MISQATKPHLSATQINMFTVCGEQYRRRYIEGEIIPPGIALLKGKAFHVGAETNMRQKIESRADLPAEQMVEAAAEAFDNESHFSYCLTDEERSRGPSAVLGEAKDSLVEMVKVHAKQQAPDYQPVMVEEEVRIALPGPRDLLGIIDLADDKKRITDFKTAKKKKPQSEADSSLQLTVYSAAYQSRTGEAPSEVRLDNIIQGKKSVERQVLSSTRSEADIGALANRINTVAAAIDAGIFIPAPVGIWQCSQKFCGYWRSCPYVNSERAEAASEE